MIVVGAPAAAALAHLHVALEDAGPQAAGLARRQRVRKLLDGRVRLGDGAGIRVGAQRRGDLVAAAAPAVDAAKLMPQAKRTAAQTTPNVMPPSIEPPGGGSRATCKARPRPSPRYAAGGPVPCLTAGLGTADGSPVKRPRSRLRSRGAVFAAADLTALLAIVLRRRKRRSHSPEPRPPVPAPANGDAEPMPAAPRRPAHRRRRRHDHAQHRLRARLPDRDGELYGDADDRPGAGPGAGGLRRVRARAERRLARVPARRLRHLAVHRPLRRRAPRRARPHRGGDGGRPEAEGRLLRRDLRDPVRARRADLRTPTTRRRWPGRCAGLRWRCSARACWASTGPRSRRSGRCG